MSFNELFGSIPDGWRSCTLGELVKEFNGSIQTGPFGSQLHAADYVEDGIPSIMPKNIRIDGVDDSDIARVSPEDINRLSKYKVQTGDIVYSRRGDVEKCSLITEKENGWLCGTGCLRVRLQTEEVSPEFLHAYLCHPAVREWIVRHAVGATMPNLNTSILSALPVLVPTSDSMAAITSNWNALSSKLVINSKINQTLEQMAQAIFKSWFVDFDPVKAKMNGEQPEGMDAATASLFPDKLVESELGLTPEGWDVLPLSRYINIKHGFAFKGEYFSDQETGDICVTPGNFRIGGGIKLDKLKYYDGPIPEDYIFSMGDLMVTMTDLSKQADTLGYPAFVPESEGKTYLHNQRIGKVELKIEQDIKNYLYSLFCSSGYRNEVLSGVTGSTVKHTAPKKIMAIEVALDLRVADKFSQLVAPLFKKKAQNLVENSYLEKLRDTLLPKLLSGEIELGAE
ncbi:restriction endonuclease subunit S [Vibrio diabolicus]|uniref:restriction endonuclease subunit S n=1 Tax=Vibrio diabolicus TaxID=50719 RepID=UPI004067F174